MRLPPNIPIYGDTSYRGECNSESAEQKDLFGRLKERYPTLYRIAIHPKNEGKRTGREITDARLMGSLVPGASDIQIPGCPSFVCELKRRDHTKSTLPKKELEYLEAAQNMGAFACIALGADGVEAAIKEWLNLYKS